MTRSILVLTLVATCACRPARDESAPDSSERVTRDSALPAPGAAMPNAALPASLDSFFVDSGACPGECCRFGRWGVKTAATLHARPDSSSGIVAEIPAGTVVRALTGILYIRPARFVLNRRIETMRYTDTDALSPGDTILLYTYIGEGFYRARRPGTTDTLSNMQFDTPGFGCERGRRPCDGHFAAPEVERWWVQIEAPSGLVGWTIPSQQFAIMEGCAAEDFPDTLLPRPQN